MKNSLFITTTVLACFLLQACNHEKTPQVSETNDFGYSSANYTPTEQFKVHRVAAFVEPTDQANLSFQVSGVIDQQLIKIGDSVIDGSLKNKLKQLKRELV